MKWQKYPAYKDSGVEWLGEIPENWETIANKYIFKLKKNLVGKKSNEYDLLSLTLKGIIKRDMENPEGKFPAEFDTYQEVKKGDFVFCLFDVEETPRTVGLSQYDGMITGAYTVMNAQDLNKEYLYYFYLNLDSNKWLKPLYKGLRNTIPKNNFFAFRTFVPPKQEQEKIALFLDNKTSQIDKTIKQKEKLIELLKEYRQIIINEAVTKGVDENGKLRIDNGEFKDSRIEWIGRIPKHWEVIRLKFLFKIRKRIANSLGFDVLSITQKGIKIKDIISGEGQLAMDYSKYQLVFKGDFAMNHMDLLTGYVDISKFDGVISPDYRVFTLEHNNCIPKYYLKLFQMCYHQKIFYAFGQGVSQLGRWRFPADNFNNFFIPIPPKQEQEKIVNYIDEKTTKIDKAIQLQQNYIEKLKEYKATLIDSVVTGKVRVV